MTDAEYLIAMAEFVPPWHQEKVKLIAKHLKDNEWRTSKKAITHANVLVVTDGIVWCMQSSEQNQTPYTHWRPMPKGPL
jgi:hypothetical protein